MSCDLRKAGKSATAINREHCNTSHTSEKRKQRERNRERETEGEKQMEGDGGKGKRQELTSDAKLLDALLVHTGHQKLFISHMQPHIYAAS